MAAYSSQNRIDTTLVDESDPMADGESADDMTSPALDAASDEDYALPEPFLSDASLSRPSSEDVRDQMQKVRLDLVARETERLDQLIQKISTDLEVERAQRKTLESHLTSLAASAEHLTQRISKVSVTSDKATEDVAAIKPVLVQLLNHLSSAPLVRSPQAVAAGTGEPGFAEESKPSLESDLMTEIDNLDALVDEAEPTQAANDGSSAPEGLPKCLTEPWDEGKAKAKAKNKPAPAKPAAQAATPKAKASGGWSLGRFFGRKAVTAPTPPAPATQAPATATPAAAAPSSPAAAKS